MALLARHLNDSTIRWPLIAAMLAPIVLAAQTPLSLGEAVPSAPLFAVAVACGIARGPVRRRRLWIALTVVGAAFWPLMLLISLAFGTGS